MQATANRTDGQIESLSDLIVIEFFKLTQNNHLLVVDRKFSDGCTQDDAKFGTLKLLLRGWFGGGHRQGRCVDTERSLFSMAGFGEVECDSVDPSEERRVTPERIQVSISLNERFLDDVLCFFVILSDRQHGAQQCLLVASD